MKVAISAQGDRLDSHLDPRFGRAKFFTCVDLEAMTHESVANGAGRDATQGAGIAAAQAVAKLGAQALITGHVGPKAFKALAAAGIEVWLCGEATVEEALRRYRRGELTAAQVADVDGHW